MRRIVSLAILICSITLPAAAQAPNTITTVAGGGTQPTTATNAYLPAPVGAVRDSLNNTYISVPGLNTVYKVDVSGNLTVFAGTGIAGFSGDGGPAVQAQLSLPIGLAIDSGNNLFIVDSNNNRIRRVDAKSSVITTVAGSEDPVIGFYAGDNGLATNARLNFPEGVAVDHNDDLYIADTFNGVVRRVDGISQIITTYAGGGATAGCSGGAATSAGFNEPIGVAVDSTGNLFISDVNLDIVCRVDATTKNITTYAGTINTPGTPGALNGDNGPATSAQMDQPYGLAVDALNNLYITDSGNPKIRKVDTTLNHIITTVAGTGFICANSAEPGCGDGLAATNASVAFDFPRGVFVASNNDILIADTNNMRVRIILASNSTINALSGGGSGGDGAAATAAILGLAQILAVDSNENVFALETHGKRLRKIASTTPNNITTIAGVGVGGATVPPPPPPTNGDGGPATAARFVQPIAITTDANGNFYILDASAQVVRVINNQATPITVATVQIQPGNIATIAGNGQRCNVGSNPNRFANHCGDGGPATSASLRNPVGIAVDLLGNVYISDAGLLTIRIVNNITNPSNQAAPGTITTHAGTQRTPCTTFPTNCGDGGPATSALLNLPWGLATDSQNNLFVADAGDNVIRKIDNTLTHTIFTVAFNGLPSFGGDGGSAVAASMTFPQQVAVDDLGDLFIGGGSNNVVRRVDAQDQTIITVAGDVNNLGGGFSGDGGPSTSAQIENFGLALFRTPQGTHDLFIADSGENRIRKVNLEPVAVINGAFSPFAPTLVGHASDPQIITITNNGLDSLIISNMTASPISGVFVISNFCTAPLAPGGVCFLEAVLQPPPAGGPTGPVNGTLAFSTNDPANPTPSFQLSGTVSATPAMLTVTENPTGAGTVISDPAGINCSASPASVCAANFASGSIVILTAFGGAGEVFTGWNNGNAPGAPNCTPTTITPCSVTLNFGQTLGANFGPAPPPGNFSVVVTLLGNGTGTVTSTPADISSTICTATKSPCTFIFPATTTPVMLTATPTAGNGSVLAGWLGQICFGAGVGPCNIGAGFPGSVAAGAVFSGPVKPFAKGQVFLSTDDGMVFVLDPTTGAVVQVLNSGTPGASLNHGLTFDSVGNLFVANENGSVLVFNNQGVGPTLFGNGNCPCDNEAHSVVVDPFGNVIVGEDFISANSQPTFLEFPGGAGPSGVPSGTFFPAYDTFSPAVWAEVLDSSDTVAYTEGTQTVKVFDLGDQVQHPDLVANLHGAFALRELPDTTILVADTDRIARVDQTGTIIQTYAIPGAPAVFFNLNLDPDGATFWTNDELTGIVYRINIKSGGITSQFNTSLGLTSILGENGIGGIAVFGQPTSGGADLSVAMTGPATVASGGNVVYSIVVTNNGPLTAQGVTLTDVVPDNLQPLFVTGPAVCTRIVQLEVSTTLSCAIGTLVSGASETFGFTINPTTTVTNTASVAGTSPADPFLGNNSSSVTTTISVSAPTLTSIAVTPANPSLPKGKTQQFTATGTFSDNSTQNLTSTVTWASATTSVATITSGGLATAAATGTSTISATQSGITGSTVMTVTAAALQSIAVTPANPSIAKGKTQQFTATGTFTDNSTQNLTSTVTWASATTSVATITSGGLATGVATGTSTISATQSGITGSTVLTVTAAALQSIAVTPANPSIMSGGTQQFTATGTFTDNSTQNLTTTVTWASATTSVATISNAAGSQGLATGVGTGTSTISATQSGISGSTVLTVTAPVTVTFSVTLTGSNGSVVDEDNSTAIHCSITNGQITGTCTFAYNVGAAVSLQVFTGVGSTFSGWTAGPCNGTTTNPCNFTISANTPSAAAKFIPTPAPVFSSTTLPPGAVTLPYGADIQVSGGQQPYSFALTNGSSLPTGFTLDATATGNAAAGHIFNNNPAANGTFTFGVTVTDSTTPTAQTATATISLTIAPLPGSTQPSLLNGHYAMLIRIFSESTGAEEGVLGGLTFDGKGGLTGVIDDNFIGGIATNQAVTGTYSIGSDNRGLMSITPTGKNPAIFAIAVGGVYQGVATTARITLFKDDTGSGDIGSGELRLQDPTAFNQDAFAGTYDFGLTGQGTKSERIGELGLITFNNALAVTSGSADINDGGTGGSITSITGTYTAPDTNGRIVENVTLVLAGSTQPGQSQVAIYQVSAGEGFAMSLDSRTTNPLLIGSGLKQSTTPFSNNSLAGPDVVSAAGVSGTGTSAFVGLATATAGASPTLTITFDSNDGGTVQTNQTESGSFSVAANGRAMLKFSTPVTAYLAQKDRGFVMTTDSSVSFGQIVPQGAISPTAPFAGNLFLGQQEAIQKAHSAFSGVAPLSSGTSFTVTDDESHTGGDLFFDQNIGTLNYAVATNGHFTVAQTTTTGALSGYVISPDEAVFFEQSNETGTPSGHPNLIVPQTQVAGPGTPSPAAPTVSFPTPVTIGQTAQSSAITITNIGLGPLGFTDVNTANSPDFNFDPTSTCIGTGVVVVLPQGTCTLILDFAPTSNTVTGKTLSETLIVQTDGTSNITIAASGTAQGVPDFTMSATPATRSVTAGGSTTYTVNVAALNGFNGSVLLFVGGFPSGATLTFNPTSITAGTPSTLTVTTASDTPPGTSTLTITGTNGSLTHSTTVQLTVTPALVSIAVAPTIATIAAGNTQRFTATGTFSDQSTQDITATVTWSSSVTAAATIITGGTAAGTATGVKAGTTVITASLSGITSNSATLTVTAPKLASIAVTPNPASVALNNTLQFTATGTFTDKSTQDLTNAVNWTSSDTTIATIGSTTGLATGVSAGGPITITATQTQAEVAGTAQLTVTSITLQMAPGSPAAPPPVAPGGTVVIGIVLGVPPGTKGTATLGCAATAPPDAAQFLNCTPVPNTVTFTGNGPTQVAVVLKTFCTDVPPAFPKIPGGLGGPLGMVLVILAVGGICFTLRRRPRWAVSFALVVIMAIGASSCGSPPAGPNGRTPAGNYTVTLTVMINGQSASLPIPITVVN